MSAALDIQSAWVERVLGLRLPSPSRAGDGPKIGMAAWQGARRQALDQLKALETAFRAMKQPQTDRAIILLRAIQANLTAEPATIAQIDALESYLATDRIIEEAEMPNGFGFKVALRVPLLAALATLKADHAAGARAA